MPDSFGLIDNAGGVLNSSRDFTATKNGNGYYTLEFDRDVHYAVIVASVRSFPYCDNQGVGVTVCNETGQPRRVGFMFEDPSRILGFSFMLVDGDPCEEG
ncbi:MAG: hypothetical protein AAGD06_22765 [Acidobacteriota bacterium]